MTKEQPYNPLEKRSLANSIADRILDRPAHALTSTIGIKGAGVYVLYYVGEFQAYAPITNANRDGSLNCPIYVGKAIPKGGRKGGLTKDSASGNVLANRLRRHAFSIKEASNLSLGEFSFRYLLVDDIWIPLGENMLIEKFNPVWNVVIDGFGNNDPGRRRAAQYKSPWDILHPGRNFAEKLANSGLTQDILIQRIDDHFAGRKLTPLPTTARQALAANDRDEDEVLD